MKISDEHLRPQSNNFTLVRLVLASAVIYTHAFWAVTQVSNRDDLSSFLGAPISTYAVDGFFFLSGFLVYPSLLRFGSLRFAAARFVRLWPALALSVCSTVLAGWAVTSASDYWTGDTLTFLSANLSLLKSYFTLTGVNCGGEPCVVNGSLWTLPWEARCYFVLFALGLLGLASPRMMKLVILPTTMAGTLLWHVPGVESWASIRLGEGVAYQITMLDRLWFCFAAGVAAFVYRDRLPISWFALALLLIVNILAQPLGVGQHTRGLFIGYAALCVAFLTARKRAVSAGWPDYSYGIYIYAFPVMMGLHAVWPTSSYALLALANLALTLPLAAISWHLLEKPCLDAFRARRVSPRRPTVAP